MLCEERYKYSAFTSFAMALVALWLYIYFPEYVNPAVSFVAFLIFLYDAYVKWFDNRVARRYTTILFSLANAFLIFGGFKYLGDPFSDIVGFLWVVDALLKIPGVNVEWEGSFRHAFSAFMSVVTGLSLLFTVRIFGSFVISMLLGIMALLDAYVKIRFLSDRCFYVG